MFDIVAHPLLVMLSRLADNGEIVGLHLPFGNQLIAQALADYSFIFLQTLHEKFQKGTDLPSLLDYVLSGGSLASSHILKGI